MLNVQILIVGVKVLIITEFVMNVQFVITNGVE